jgi:digeranylgeranylglycerophospholipid reductase
VSGAVLLKLYLSTNRKRQEYKLKTHYNVVVVGAGPAGSLAAKAASEKSLSVLMLEKDRDVGYPVRCAEAVRKDGIEEFIEPDKKWIAAVVDKFSFISPDDTEAIIDLKMTGYILERRIFDYELAKSASKAGAEVLTKAYVNGLQFNDGKVAGVKYEYQGEQRLVTSDIVIAADGVESRIGRWAGLKTYIDFRDMECCVQVTASNINIKPDTIYFYFGSEVAPQGYLWVFPKGNDIANIGLGVNGMIGKRKSALSFLKDFLAKHFPDASILTIVAGGVPCSGTLKKISAPGIMLAGDAARQVNPLTGGGIVSSMVAGNLAGSIAAESIKNKKPDYILTYDSTWEETLGKKHKIYNRLKEGIYNFSDENFNSIAKSFSRVPEEKRTIRGLFQTALFDRPSLLLDVVKVFI